MLINAKEELLKEILHQYLHHLNMNCHCVKCIEDVLAIALNQVKPQYITDIEKLTYSKSEMVDKQKNTAMLVILIEAAAKVTTYPRCEIQLAKKGKV
ncbi:late competence development ComFB family protein [Bacillus sp. NPDC077027]|uniref:late competence development ComFB family protein n=1 Tax=Bacillus sp. NPDC077027 TaxID=3390548 RepID=UPI003CFE3A2C